MAKNRNNQTKQTETPAPAAPVEPTVDAVEQEQEVVTHTEVAEEVVSTPASPTPPPIEDEPVIEAPAADAGVLAQAPSFAAAKAIATPPAPTVEAAESKEVELLRVYLSNYVTDIQNPANKNTTNGARCQLGFYRLIYGVLASKTEFTAKFKVLLDFMRKHADGVCNSRSLFAYYPSIPTDPKQAANFLTATQFCSTLATAKTPEDGIKQVDLGRVLTALNNPQITHNVSNRFR